MEAGVQGEKGEPEWGERNRVTGWGKWRATEKKRRQKCRGAEGETDSEGEKTDRSQIEL